MKKEFEAYAKCLLCDGYNCAWKWIPIDVFNQKHFISIFILIFIDHEMNILCKRIKIYEMFLSVNTQFFA